MENYIMLDGKKIALTEEQITQLRSTGSASGVPRRFNPFDRTEGSYWYCMTDKKALISVEIRDDHDLFDNEMYDDLANYFNDEGFAMYVDYRFDICFIEIVSDSPIPAGHNVSTPFRISRTNISRKVAFWISTYFCKFEHVSVSNFKRAFSPTFRTRQHLLRFELSAHFELTPVSGRHKFH